MTDRLKIGSENNANERITADEKQYMQDQLKKETSEAKTELSQYKSTIMVERRDANYDLLKGSISQMEDAISNSENTQATSALQAYKDQFFINNKKTGYLAKGRSYVIALYQTLLYIKASPEDRNLLGSYGGCKCGVDGIFGLDTLMLSAKVLKSADAQFHGVVNETTLGVLCGTTSGDQQKEIISGEPVVPLALKDIVGGDITIAPGDAVSNGTYKIFDVDGNSVNVETKDANFASTMRDRKVQKNGNAVHTLMQHNEDWYIWGWEDPSGYYPVQVLDGKVQVDAEGQPIRKGNNQVITEPVITEAVITEAVITEPVITEAVITEPVITEAVITEAVITEAVITEAVITEAVITESGTVEREQVVIEVADLTQQAANLVDEGNRLRDSGNLSAAVTEYQKSIDMYMQVLQKIASHNESYPTNTIDVAELTGLKSGLEIDVIRYKEQIIKNEEQKEQQLQAEQQVRGKKLIQFQQTIQSEGLTVAIDGGITGDTVTEEQQVRGERLTQFQQTINDEELSIIINSDITAESVTQEQLNQIKGQIDEAKAAKDLVITEEKKRQEKLQEARTRVFNDYVNEIREESLQVVINDSIIADKVSDEELSSIIIQVKNAREQKELEKRVQRAEEASITGREITYNTSAGLFQVDMPNGPRSVDGDEIESRDDLQGRVELVAKQAYNEHLSGIVLQNKQIIGARIATDRQVSLNRSENENIVAFDTGFKNRKEFDDASVLSLINTIIKYNALGGGFLDSEIQDYTSLLQDVNEENLKVEAIDTILDQKAQQLLANNVEITYDGVANTFSVKGLTLPRGEVMNSANSLGALLDKANQQLTTGTSVMYDVKNKQFFYKGSKQGSANINNADDLKNWVKQIDVQLEQQRNTLDLNEGSSDIRGIQAQITGLNLYIQNQDDAFKLINKTSEQGTKKKKKSDDTPLSPDREIRYSLLLEPPTVSLKNYMTVDNIVDVPLLQKEVRTQIENVYPTKSREEKSRLVVIYEALGGLESSLSK